MAAATLGSTDLEKANFCLACGDTHVLQLLSLMQILLLPLLPSTLQPLPRYRVWRTLFPRTAWTTAFWKTQRRRMTKGSHRPSTVWIVKGKKRRVAQGHTWMCSLDNVVQPFSDSRPVSCPGGFLAVLWSVVAFTVSHLVTVSLHLVFSWEGGKADYHLPGVAVLLCVQIKPLGPLDQEGIFLLAEHTKSFEIFSFWSTVHFAGILCFA